MQTNILDWLEATSARCPDAPAVGDDQTDCTWAQLADTARRAGSFLASRTMPRRPVAFLPGKIRFRLCYHAWHSLRGLLLLGA